MRLYKNHKSFDNKCIFQKTTKTKNIVNNVKKKC